MSQRVFVVVGAKGGVGATTLAIKLIQRMPAAGERMIVDADLAGKRSLAVFYDLNDDLDLSLIIGKATVAKAKAGPLVMELARTYEDGLIPTADSVIRSIGRLSENALVVVDAPQPFAATVRPLMARAAKIIVITEPSLLGIGAARAMLGAMERSGMTTSRIAFVLSDVHGKGEVPRADVEQALRTPVSVELPNEKSRKFDEIFNEFVDMLASSSA